MLTLAKRILEISLLAQGGNGCTETFTYYVDVGEDVDDIYTLSYGATTLTPCLNNRPSVDLCN